MTTPRRSAATGLPDHVVERIVVGVIMLRGQLDIGDTCAAILYARWAWDAGIRDWPQSLDELAAALPARDRGRHLWLVPPLARAESFCPSGAA